MFRDLVYTDTKMNVLFRAGARMSVIKLFLARNTIPFCSLNKTRRQPGILQGFLSTNLVYLFADRTFPGCSLTPARNSPGILEIRWVYQFPAGTFPGCSLTPARNAPGSFVIRWVYLFPAWTFPGLFPSLAFLVKLQYNMVHTTPFFLNYNTIWYIQHP